MKHLPFTKVFNDESGGNIKTKKGDYLENGLIPIVDQGEDLIGGFTNDENKICKSDLPVIVFGDHTRRFKFVDFPFGMGADGVKVLKPKIEANEKYLYYYLKALRLTDAGYDRHFKYLKRTEILIPPLPEQKRIAEVLDKADALIQKRRQAIEKLDTLLQSVFLEMFGDPVKNPMGWDVSELSQIVEKDRSITYGILKPGDFTDNGIPMLRIQDLKKGEINIENVHRVSSELSTQYKRTILKGGEIVISLVGTIGLAAIIPQDFSGFNLHRNLGMISLNESVHPQYFYYLVSHPFFSKVIKNITKGGNQPLLNLGDLNKVLIILPPLSAQENFAKKAIQVNKLKKSLEISSMKSENLFQSLQQKAFKGELFEMEGREAIEEASAG